ncbi:Aste57867_543 [Aphanomyces stellatus]|uniref:Aste57867_543 protein n=1 Tax=Aphanomyces stellatus TaxID=120398 RepID=A0A485K386_9STRA|nr:hypothetical protein As57867_000542 [Aphanomyces stellatus]VFT77768.1 Aste57867_543 [Aphanomyces stellatus]
MKVAPTTGGTPTTDATACPGAPAPTSESSFTRRLSGLTGMSELEWYVALRRPILVLVFVFHGLSSLNFGVLALLLLTATPYETQCFRLFYPRVCGVIYTLVACLHLSPFVRPLLPSLPAHIHASTHLFGIRHRHLWYRCLAKLSIPPHIGPVVVRTFRVLCQTWVAYDMARLLVDRQAAGAYAFILVVNCLATSWMVLLKYTGLQKTMLFFFQSFLAFLLSSGFPLFAFIFPVLHYKFENSGNAAHDLAWLTRTMSSTHFLVISQPYQLVLNVGLSGLNYVALQNVATRLTGGRRHRRPGPTSLSIHPHGGGQHHSTVMYSSAWSSRLSISHPAAPRSNTTRKWSSRLSVAARVSSQRFSDGMHTIVTGIHQLQIDHEHRRFLRLIFALDLTWSVVVFAVSVSAQYFRTPCPPHCVLDSAPWFSTSCNCLYARVDCRATISSIDAISALDANTLGTNVVMLHTRYCDLPHGLPATVLAPYQSIYGLVLEFTGMQDWDIAGTDLPDSLMLVEIRYSHLTSVPLVLQSPGPLWNALFLVGAPVGDIPPSIFQRWANLSSLWLSETNMTTFPPAILHMPWLDTLAVDGNHLTTIPDGLETLPYLTTLYLDRNNISTFPTTLVQTKPSLQVFLNQNPITAIPPSLVTWLGQNVDVASTPFCSMPPGATAPAAACTPDCSPACARPHWGNYLCDVGCNTTVCAFDNGDCTDDP